MGGDRQRPDRCDFSRIDLRGDHPSRLGIYRGLAVESGLGWRTGNHRCWNRGPGLGATAPKVLDPGLLAQSGHARRRVGHLYAEQCHPTRTRLVYGHRARRSVGESKDGAGVNAGVGDGASA